MNYGNFKKNNHVKGLVNRFKTVRDKILRIKSTITFLIRCRKTGITPKFISNSSKNVVNIFSKNGLPSIQNTISKYTQDLHNKILNLTLKEKHELLKQTNCELEVIKGGLGKHFTQKEMKEFLEYEVKLTKIQDRKFKEIHKKKFNSLVDIRERELGITLNNRWFVNKTGKDIPTEVQWVLSLPFMRCQ